MELGRGVLSGRLDGEGYENFREAAETYRERLVILLGGEVGLRPAEMVEIRPRDVTARVHNGEVHYFLEVGSERPREAYLPAEVHQEFTRYVQSNAIADDERVLSVTPRRIQMLVASIADRFAEETGDQTFEDMSTADLRRYFAYVNLVERGIPPSVVMAIGGWKRLDSLDPVIEPADRDEVVAAFDEASGPGGVPTHRFRDALDHLQQAILLFDANGTVEYVNRRFEAITGSSISAIRGDSLRDLGAAEQPSKYADIWETVTDGEIWVGEFAIQRAIADPIHGQLTLLPIPSDTGIQERFVATFTASSVETGQAERTLERLGQINPAIRSAETALQDASTREEVFRQVCQAMTDAAAYEFAWISDVDSDGTVVPRVWGGTDEGTIEDLALTAQNDTHPEARAVERREVQLVSFEDADGVVTADGNRPTESPSILTTPLVHGETVFGALSVVTAWVAENTSFERTALASLGARIGHALAAIEWKQLLLADTVLELEFVSEDADSFFVAASKELACTLRLEGMVPVEGQNLLLYITVSGVGSEEIIAFLNDFVDAARLISEYPDESLIEATATDTSLVATLIDHGGAVQELVSEDGRARLVVEFPPDIDVRALNTDLSASSPSFEIVAKREVERPVRTPAEFHWTVEDELTAKQRSVLKAAYHAGYFEWPRGSTAENLADSLGIASPTLHNHLRRAQQKLLTTYFDELDE